MFCESSIRLRRNFRALRYGTYRGTGACDTDMDADGADVVVADADADAGADAAADDDNNGDGGLDSRES